MLTNSMSKMRLFAHLSFNCPKTFTVEGSASSAVALGSGIFAHAALSKGGDNND